MNEQPTQTTTRAAKPERLPFHAFFVAEADKTTAKAMINNFITFKPSGLNESDIDLDFVIRFGEYMEEKKIAKNTQKVYFTILKSILRKSVRRGYPVSLDFDDVSKEMAVSSEASESVYLTREELGRIEQYEPKCQTERFARAMFLLCAYTGCRISDAIIMSENNYHNGEITYASEKTKITARMPLHPIVPDMIKEVSQFDYDEASIRKIVGHYMKQIGKSVGIDERLTMYRRGKRTTAEKWEFISSHTARKSFVTNLYIDGYTIEQISKMAGHKNTIMTERYLCVSHTTEITGQKTYFKPFCDTQLERLNALLGAGLSIEQAASAMLTLGVSPLEVDRVVGIVRNR